MPRRGDHAPERPRPPQASGPPSTRRSGIGTLTLLGGGVSGLAVIAATHHLAGADLWGLASLGHLITTVVLPTLLIAVSLTFLSTPSAHSREPARGGERAPVLAYSTTDGPRDPRPESGGRAGDHRAIAPVDQFFRVTFADERGYRLWTERVVEFTAILQDVFPTLQDLRPVVFVQLRPSREGPLHAYVSAGARGLAAHISGGAKVDPTPITAAELPPGLTMLFGEGADAAEYESRHL